MRIEEALGLFVLQLEADGRSAHTIGQYQRHVSSLTAWLAQERLSAPLANVGHELLARFLASPAARTRPDGKPKRAGSMNAMRSSLRGFFAYLVKAGIIDRDPSILVRRARAQAPAPRGLSGEALERLLAVMEGAGGEAASRDAVLVRLMATTGIRLSSALALEVEDLDLERCEAHVRRLKGGGEQVVFLRDGICELLQGHLRDRLSGPIFVARGGGRLCHRQAQRRFQVWAEKAGLGSRFSPHSLRHGFAMQLYARTGDVLVVQQALGHASISSTLVYARADQDRVREAVLAG
jgi:integrase/recombinase XerD